jgi:hypothetical protein
MITDSKGPRWGYGDERGEEIISKEVWKRIARVLRAA